MNRAGSLEPLADDAALGWAGDELHYVWDDAGGPRTFCGTPGPLPAADDEDDPARWCGLCVDIFRLIGIARDRASGPPPVRFDTTADGKLTSVCPHCGANDSIVDEDECLCANHIEWALVEGEPVGYPDDGERTFETVRYACRRCNRTVHLDTEAVPLVYG